MKTLLLYTSMLIIASLFFVSTALAEEAKKEGTKQEAPAYNIRKIDEQVVLYSVHRGAYDKLGPSIGKLFSLAMKKGMKPCGAVEFAFLNNPKTVSSEHLLTEIRIPVKKEALKSAGTLGGMTDVKTVTAHEAVIGIKPEGMADPAPIYTGLFRWMHKNGFMAVDSPRERYLTNAMSGDYSKMKTEIILPIAKFPEQKNER